MNFQDLKKIEGPDFYLDVAFRKASKRVSEIRSSSREKDRFNKSKNLELTRLELIRTVLTEQLNKITDSFPSIDKLDEFYKELIKCTLDYRDLKKSLGSVSWAVDKIHYMYKFYKNKIIKTKDHRKINSLRKEFYGRVSSILKQIKPYLFYLEESRKTMRNYPAIKTSLYTVCLFGFPNVGKSTLLKKLTTADPEINAYPFTTKKLNLGYIKTPKTKIQVIDTPGTLNRLNKMNYIELQAYLAVKHLADLIVYVFDPSLEYSFEKQEKLLKKLEEFDKEIVLYMSKTDIADKDVIKQYKKKYSKIQDFDSLKEDIVKKAVKAL